MTKVKLEEFTDLLLQLTNELASLSSLEEVLDRLVTITTSAINADRGTIFLNDEKTDELYSRVAQGEQLQEIRMLNDKGIAGWVFTNEKGIIVKHAYSDKRFNQDIDEQTGYRTKNIVCCPIYSLQGKKVGVAQALNKKSGNFTQKDLELLQIMTKQAATVIQNFVVLENIEISRKQEMEFLHLVSNVSSELDIGQLLKKIMGTIIKILDADRSTLFINDVKTNELFSEIGDGDEKKSIRFPNHLGIAGSVFTSGESINISHAYADLRFNPAVDKQTGYFTQSILCMPVKNKKGKIIGVTQVLNKHGGVFTEEDEIRLEAFTSQIAVGIENATLFDDIQNMKYYTESILSSMKNVVITVDEDKKITTCNRSGLHLMQKKRSDVVGQFIYDVLHQKNQWLVKKLDQLEVTRDEKDLEEEEVFESKYRYLEFLDTELEFDQERKSCNTTIHPLLNDKQEKLGAMIMIEDISQEKRMKSTMSKYMDAELANQLLDSDESFLGGQESISTVLFSDIRSFTTITEELGAQGTVSLLNEYFTLMVDCIQKEGGVLDKFIGDAMMAVFGIPLSREDDPDRGLRAAIAMMRELSFLNQHRKKSGLIIINHGMGLNTDSIVSGNIGSPKRMDYTVIGDGVNLAARLESACKAYGANILISEFTFRALKATYKTREIDQVIVKGKTEPIGVVEVLDFHSDKTFPNMAEALEVFNFGYDFYKKGAWNKAIQQFNKCLKLNPKDTCTTMYLGRCDQLKAKPPKNWDGVWVMKTK